MLLSDVSVLVYAHREDSERHLEYREWVEQALDGDESFALPDLVLSSFIRIVTHPRIYARPTTIAEALTFVGQLRSSNNSIVVNPGQRHWDIFERLCVAVDPRGNLVSDAYLAALAIESGSDFITVDCDFARFPGLRWRHPLEQQ